MRGGGRERGQRGERRERERQRRGERERGEERVRGRGKREREEKTGIRWGWSGVSAGETAGPWKFIMFLLELNGEVGLLYTARQGRG